MSRINYTTKKNIRKTGETVRGEGMYSIVDNKGELISKMYAGYMDYELATFYIDWINEGNTKPHGMKEVLKIVKEREEIK